MTKQESLLNERNYEIWNAEQMLNLIHEGMFYDKYHYHTVCLYNVPFCFMSNEMFEQLDKWYKVEKHLIAVLEGREQEPLYREYYHFMKRRKEI